MTSVTASVIVATLNEAANVDHVVDIALSDEAVIEVIIADGGSNDKTVDKIHARAAADDRVKLIHNPDRGQAAGLNMAAASATGTLLIRLDGHTRYANDYVSASLGAWRPGVAVGGTMLAEGSSPWARATASAMQDPLAIGPARFHHADDVEEVDTVYLGTFDRSTFLAIGGYRSFPSGTVEDTDFYVRWRANGGTVIVDPDIRSWYKPRATWRGLLRQYFRYGRGKAELVWLNGQFPSPRPLAPALLIAGVGVSVVLGLVATWIPLAVLTISWAAVLGIVALRSSSLRIRTAAAAATMHAAYGTGLWWGLSSGRPDVQALGMHAHVETSEAETGTREEES